MADQQSIGLLAFNFTSRTFAYRRLAEGLCRFLAVFSSFICKYLEPIIEADQCAQYIDDIGLASNTAQQLIKNLRAVFQCLSEADLKFSMTEVLFRSSRNRLPWTYNNNELSRSAETKNNQVSGKCQFSKIQKSTSTPYWISKLLSKLFTQAGKSTDTVLPTS